MSRYRTRNVLSIWEEPEEKNCWETDYMDDDLDRIDEDILDTFHRENIHGLFDVFRGESSMFHSWDEDGFFKKLR